MLRSRPRPRIRASGERESWSVAEVLSDRWRIQMTLFDLIDEMTIADVDDTIAASSELLVMRHDHQSFLLLAD